MTSEQRPITVNPGSKHKLNQTEACALLKDKYIKSNNSRHLKIFAITYKQYLRTTNDRNKTFERQEKIWGSFHIQILVL